jgi:small subunit ribosomal protein S20
LANSRQARKRSRQAEVQRTRNASQRSMYRTYLKNVSNAIEANDKETALETLASAVRVLDRMVSKGIVHKNNAARRKSRLSAKVGALE